MNGPIASCAYCDWQVGHRQMPESPAEVIEVARLLRASLLEHVRVKHGDKVEAERRADDATGTDRPSDPEVNK